MERSLFFVLLACCWLSVIWCEYMPCKRLDFGQSSFVCECSVNYCDEFINDEPFDDVLSGEFKCYTSSQTKDRFLLSKGKLLDKHLIQDEFVTIELNPNITYQTIKGFGAAFSDSASYHFHNMRHMGLRKKALTSYFSESNGIGFTLARIPIGCTDFSLRGYTYDDIDGDFDLNHFTLAEEDINYKIPAIKDAVEISKGKLKLFGTPWSSPGWMKTSGNISGGTSMKGNAGDKYHKTWANYLVKFIDEYEASGVKLWGITVQNEPFMGQLFTKDIVSVPLLGYTAEQERDFIKKDFGPLMKAKYPHVIMMMLDGMRLFLDRWVRIVLSDHGAAKYISGIAHHWYMDDLIPVMIMDFVHKLSPDKFLLGTEACTGVKSIPKGVLLGSWERGEKYSGSIIDDLNHWNVGWMSWNLVLDTQGGPSWLKDVAADSSMILDYENNVFYKQPMFYHFGHLSRFLPPGSVRVHFNMAENKNIKSTAFKTPNSTFVVIVLNTDEHLHPLKICFVEGKCIQSKVGPRSIQSYVFKE